MTSALRTMPGGTRSHLLTTSTVARPASSAYPAMWASWAVTPPEASRTTRATWTALQTLPGHDHRELFEHFADPPLAPDARRVDQHVGMALVEERGVHGIARGAGRRIDEDAFRAHHGVHQGRLAHVRAADDGDMGGRLPDRFLRLRRRGALAHDLQEFGHATPVLGGDRVWFAKAQAVEIGRERLGTARVDLVGDEHDGMGRAAQGPRQSRSSAVTPARASTTKNTRSASSTAASTCRRTPSISGSPSAGSKPPVSMTVACQRPRLIRRRVGRG